MDDVPVTLREATESGLVPATLEALRSAALRDKDFPNPVVVPRGRGGANHYSAEALVRWCEQRPRSHAGDLQETLERWREQRSRPRTPTASITPMRSPHVSKARGPKRRSRYFQPLVYFIVRGGKPQVGHVVKIGHTDNLAQRLANFCDHPNDVVRKIEVVSVDESKRLEREFHECWADLRVYPNREQFWIRDGLARFLGVTLS